MTLTKTCVDITDQCQHESLGNHFNGMIVMRKSTYIFTQSYNKQIIDLILVSGPQSSLQVPWPQSQSHQANNCFSPFSRLALIWVFALFQDWPLFEDMSSLKTDPYLSICSLLRLALSWVSVLLKDQPLFEYWLSFKIGPYLSTSPI